MAKALRTAAIVVGAVALVATGVGAIAGVGTAIGAQAGAIAAIARPAASVLGIAATALASRATARVSGNATEFAADPGSPVPYLIGRTATAGRIVYWREHGSGAGSTPNDRQTFVAILSGGGPVQQIESFSADRAAISFGAGGNATGTYNRHMWQVTQLGLCPETSHLSLVPNASDDPGTPPPGWTTAHKLSGYAAAMWSLRFDSKGKFYTNGTPKPLWVVKGVKVYDPRLDSTYPGGSGACRALDEATYVWSENPYLHALTWCLGRWQNGKRVLGIGAPITGINVAAFVEGANIADVNGWTAGGVVYSADDKWEVLKQILQAGGGEPVTTGARISCFVNAPKVPLDTVEADDVVGEVSVTATQPRRDRINSLIPSYRDAGNNWEVVSGTPITVDDYVTFDGGLRQRSAPYALVQSSAQAAVLARYEIENAREFGPITLSLKPRWIGYRPGDCITINVPEAGLVDRAVLILRRDIDPSTGVVTLTCRSETEGKHPFALGQTTTPPPTPGVSGPPLVPVPAVDAWEITATSLTANGVTVPTLVVEGTVDIGTAEAVIFEYRPFASGQGVDDGWIAAGVEPPTVRKKEIASVTPDTVYEVAISYRVRGVDGDRRVIGPVATDDWDGIAGTRGPSGASAYNLVQSASGRLDLSTPGTVTKTAGGADAWDASFRSVSAYAGGVMASIRLPFVVGNGPLIGFDTTDALPENDTAWQDLDYCVYVYPDGRIERIVNSATTIIGTAGTAQPGDVISIGYDGKAGRIWRNNALLDTYDAIADDQLFYVKGSIKTLNGRIENLSIAPGARAGDKGDKGDQGAPGTPGSPGTPGNPGTPATSVEISRKAVNVWAYANGGVVSWADANGMLKVRSGNTDVTAGATLSYNPSSGVTGTINAADNTPVSGKLKGYYQVTAMTGDTGTLTLQATYGGVTLTETFSVSKTKGGYEIVSDLPTVTLFEGRVVYRTTDDKLYRYTGSAWTAAVPAFDISGQLADAQIAALAASKITGQLSDGQVAALAAAKLTGQITATQITDGAISTPKLAAGSITTAKLAAGAVTANEVASNAVTAAKIAAGAVEAAKLAADSVTAGKIAANAVTAGTIATDAVTAGTIAANAVTSDKINAGAITTTKLASTQASLMFATIGTFQTSPSGERVEITDAYIKVFDDNNMKRVHIGDLSV